MDYQTARAIGDAGEAQMRAELERLASRRGFTVLNDVLIGKRTGSRTLTAQLDHVVTDELGILVIETKVRRGATIRGTYADSKWTAVYPGGKTQTFLNPLRQNEQHLNLLHQVLKDTGVDLGLDRIRGLVVFVDADLTHLALDSVTALRVTDIRDLEDWFAQRYDFMVQTPLSPQMTARIADTVRALDRSDDPAFVQAHSASRAGGRQAALAGRASDSEAPGSTFGASGPQSILRKLRIPLFVAAACFFAWAVWALATGNAPAWLWIALLLVLSGFAEEGSRTSRRRRRARRTTSASDANGASRDGPFTELVNLVVRIGLAVALLWAFFTWGPRLFDWWAASLTRQQTAPGPAATPQTPAPEPAPDIELAKQRLKEAAPDVFRSLTDPHKPVVTRSGDLFSYRWQYIRRSNNQAVSVEEIEITLDQSGRIVRVSD